MSSLVVGGTAIPVFISSPSWSNSDAVDRARAFDNTFRASQTGGAVREWDFETPAVTQALANQYRSILGKVQGQICSGDILELPTWCSTEITGGTPTAVGGQPYEVLQFRLHEITPAKTLLRYAAGDTIAGESYSRASTAYWRGVGSGGVDVKAINVKRDAHYVGGFAPQTFLLEGARTNPLLWANDFSNAAWVKTTMTVGTGISAPDGTTTACTLTATAGSARVTQSLAAGSSLARTMSLWIKRRTGTGTIQIAKPDNSTYTTVAVTASWERYTAVGAASTTRYAELNIVTSGDAIDVWCGQIDDAPFETSEIPTTTVAVTRAADLWSLPFTETPKEMSAYLKFTERGTVAGTRYLLSISDATPANPAFGVDVSGGAYRAFHGNGPTTVLSTLGVAPALNDTVELVAYLLGDGSVQITQSINGGAATTSTQSAANTFAAAWSGLLCWINSGGTFATSVGFTALHAFKIVAGSRSLAEMRAL